MSFLKLFTGVKMSLEFDKLRIRVATAAAVISNQIAEIADLKAKLAASVPAPAEVTEADYAALSKALDDVLPVPATAEVPVDSTLAVDGLSHPALS
jgi:hypothetical protein